MSTRRLNKPFVDFMSKDPGIPSTFKTVYRFTFPVQAFLLCLWSKMQEDFGRILCTLRRGDCQCSHYPGTRRPHPWSSSDLKRCVTQDRGVLLWSVCGTKSSTLMGQVGPLSNDSFRHRGSTVMFMVDAPSLLVLVSPAFPSETDYSRRRLFRTRVNEFVFF